MGVRRDWVTGPGARVRLAGAALALVSVTFLGTSCTGSSHRGSGMRPVVVSGRVVTAVCPQVPSPLRTRCTLTPAAGATVVLVGANGEPATSAVSGDDGSFSLTASLAPGSSTVRATGPQPGAAGPATATVTIDVLAGSGKQRVNGLELRLDTGIRLSTEGRPSNSAQAKLLLNFTWWVNRKDAQGNNIFEGGFLGMDNIGPIDRSNQVPPGYLLEQSDGTAWMAMYCLDLWEMCLLLSAGHDPVYADLAIKFLEHFATIAGAMRNSALWNEDDGFYYDILTGGGDVRQLRVQSIVSLRKLPRILARVFDEQEFLAPTGVRSLSKAHEEHPFVLDLPGLAGWRAAVGYEPAESRSGLFGGNSNWRGPVWFPVNHLLVESLRRYAEWTGDSLLVELPTGSGQKLALAEAADEIAGRLVSTFLRGPDGVRPFARPAWNRMPAAWRDRIRFHEYFHDDTGAGLGASHQTGWTALVIDLLDTHVAPSRLTLATAAVIMHLTKGGRAGRQ